MTESTLTDEEVEKLLRTKSGEEIVQQILGNMQSHMFYVGDTMAYKDGKVKIKENPIPAKPVLYRWWFPKDSKVWKVITDYHKEHLKDDTVFANCFKKVEQCTIKGKVYYALYFGKSNKGSRRYKQHTKGTVGNSTIRHTVYGLLFPDQKYDPNEEKKISDIVRQCYCEWVAIDCAECADSADCAKKAKEAKGANWIGCLESLCIALGNYPLNVDGNLAISKDWRKRLIQGRKDSKKERKSRD